MSFISSQNRRTLIVDFITPLVICEMVAYVAAIEFGWNANSKHRVAWLQVWFNMTSAGQT